MNVQNYIGGEWSLPATGGRLPVHNPATGEVIAETPVSTASEVDAAVKAAHKAFESWSRTPAPKRAGILFRYKALLEDQFENLARLLTLENGKTLDEARGDIRRGIEVVEFSCGIPHLLKGESLPQVAEEIDAATTREPLGVCAGITPFPPSPNAGGGREVFDARVEMNRRKQRKQRGKGGLECRCRVATKVAVKDSTTVTTKVATKCGVQLPLS